jgi:RNA polymerase sigma factor (sigma-70 family)
VSVAERSRSRANRTYRAATLSDDDIEQICGVIVRQVTGGRDEDMLQEARCAAFLALRRYDPSRGASERTWLFLKVRGAVIDYIRKQRPTPILRLIVDRGDPMEPVDDRIDAYATLRHVCRSVPNQRTWSMIAMRLDGRRNKEIGAHYGISESRVSQIFARTGEIARQERTTR